MKKLINFTFILFLLTAGVSAQTPASTPIPYFDKVHQTYDKFDDSTTTEVEFRLLKNDSGIGDSLRLNLTSKFSGTKPLSSNNTILITIVSFDTETYSSSSKLIFLADNERLRPNFVNHKIVRYKLIDDLIEYTSFSISQEELKKLAFSKKNEGRIDSTEFTINDQSLKLIQDFYKKLVP